MYLMTVCILYGIGAVHSACVWEQAVFHDVEVLEGYNITSSILDVISRYESMNRIDCAKQCSKLDNCLSFFHNSITNQCQFHTEVFLDNTGATTQADTVYFYQVGKVASIGTFHCPTEDGFQMLGSDEMCVKFHTDTKTWSDANAECASYSPNGHLVVVDTEVHDDLVRDVGLPLSVNLSNSMFIGLKIDGWVDGSSLVYTSWVSGASFTPGARECVYYKRDMGWMWKAVDCNRQKPYICQISF